MLEMLSWCCIAPLITKSESQNLSSSNNPCVRESTDGNIYLTFFSANVEQFCAACLLLLSSAQLTWLERQ